MKTTDFTLTSPIVVTIGTAGSLEFRTVARAVDHLLAVGASWVDGQPRNRHGMVFKFSKHGHAMSADQIATTWASRVQYWRDAR